MHGRNSLDVHPSEAALATALRALPDSAPEPDLWPGLAQALATRRTQRRRRFFVPAALAAGVALALLLPRLTTRDVQAPIDTPIASTATHDAATASASSARENAVELTALRERSRTLERWVAAVASRAPQDGRNLMAAVEVEDLIGLVDVQLGGARGDADALPLWRQRVALLEDLAAIRGNGFAFAASADAMPASLNLLN